MDVGTQDNVKLFENIGKLDRFELKTKLMHYSLEVSVNKYIEYSRNILKKVVLEEILKSEVQNRNYYSACLKEVIDHFYLGSSEKFLCCLAGCRFHGVRHRDYVVHLKRCHPNLSNILCNFKNKCKQCFTGIDSLLIHLKEFHSSSESVTIAASNVPISIPCKCNRLSCGGRHFKNVQELMRHWNTFHSNEERDCPFAQCLTTFSKSSMSRHHFNSKHKHTNNMTLKARHLLTIEAPVDPEEVSVQSLGSSTETVTEPIDNYDDPSEFYNESDFHTIEVSEAENDADTTADEDFYLSYYADFLNRLTNMKFIPQTTVQEISEEYMSNTRKSLENREKLLRKSLSSIPSIDQADIEKVVKDVIQNDKFLKAQISLNSEYKRTKFIQENMSYVGPCEIVLNKEAVQQGRRKEVLHYVPITDSVKNLLEDPSLNKMFAMKPFQRTSDNRIKDLKDGSVFKQSEFLQGNPEAYSIILYSDAVEIKVTPDVKIKFSFYLISFGIY